MNKRIKEVLLKIVPMAGEDGDLLPSLHTQKDIEKFAELIANECAKICDQQGRCGWNDDRKQQARVDAELIREHFGVE